MKKEILILGTIFLFIGIGIQPAFAVELNLSNSVEEVEDCNCNVVDNYDIKRIERLLNRVESSLNRVEIRTKSITKLSKDNPEVIEDCEELSEKIKTFRELNEELNTAISGRDFPIICTILLPFMYAIGLGWAITAMLFEKYWHEPIQGALLLGLLFLFLILYDIMDTLLDAFGCLPDY